jgi:hypothetical protein
MDTMCETTPTMEELAERMRAAKVRAEVVKRQWMRYEATEEEKNAAEAEFAKALDVYRRARIGSRKAPTARKPTR